jgi:hypothetical protein
MRENSTHECMKNCSEGFEWVHDECIEIFEFDSDETNDNRLLIFDDEATTESVFPSAEDSEESTEDLMTFDGRSTTTATFENTSESDYDSEADNEDDEGGSGVVYETTERFEFTSILCNGD